MAAGETVAACFDWPEVRLVETGFDADRPLVREGRAVARHARWQDAIEHVDAARDQLDQLRRCAQPHRVPRQARRQERLRQFNRLENFRFRLADAHAADGVTIKLHRDDGLRALLAQRGVGAALDDAKNQLAGRARLLAALLRPANGPLDRAPEFVRRAGVRRAIVKRHGNIGAELALDFHCLLWPEKKQRAVQMRTKFDAVRFDLSDFGQTEDLKSAAVGQNWQ